MMRRLEKIKMPGIRKEAEMEGEDLDMELGEQPEMGEEPESEEEMSAAPKKKPAGKESPLAAVSDDELMAEVKARGLDMSSGEDMAASSMA